MKSKSLALSDYLKLYSVHQFLSKPKSLQMKMRKFQPNDYFALRRSTQGQKNTAMQRLSPPNFLKGSTLSLMMRIRAQREMKKKQLLKNIW